MSDKGKLKGHSLQNSGDSIALIINTPEKKNPNITDRVQNIIVIILNLFAFFFVILFLIININDIIGKIKLIMLI